jgi:pyridoxine 5-phosphate synthase
VELHTGFYANAITAAAQAEELEKLVQMAEAASKFGLSVNAGHGLTYQNVRSIAKAPFIEELNIGHAIISRATLVGIQTAVRDMLQLITCS